MNEFPDFILKYLHMNKQLTDLKTKEKELKVGLTELSPVVTEWLKSIPKYEVNLEFFGDQEDSLGPNGKLRFSFEKRKEYLGKQALFTYMCSFFSNIYNDKDETDIEQLVTAAVDHIWSSRKTLKNIPVVTRTVNKKRKNTSL